MSFKTSYTAGYSGYKPGEKWSFGGASGGSSADWLTREANNNNNGGGAGGYGSRAQQQNPFGAASQTESDVAQVISHYASNNQQQRQQQRCPTCGSLAGAGGDQARTVQAQGAGNRAQQAANEQSGYTFDHPPSVANQHAGQGHTHQAPFETTQTRTQSQPPQGQTTQMKNSNLGYQGGQQQQQGNLQHQYQPGATDHSRRQAYLDHQKEANKFGEDKTNPFHGLQGTNTFTQPGNTFGRAAVSNVREQQQGRARAQAPLGQQRDVPAPGFTGHIPGMKENDFGRSYGAAAEMCRQQMHDQQAANQHLHMSQNNKSKQQN